MTVLEDALSFSPPDLVKCIFSQSLRAVPYSKCSDAVKRRECVKLDLKCTGFIIPGLL